MSKKHFIRLADTIRAAMPSKENNPSVFAHWEIMRDSLANFCQEQNPNFNRARWTQYIAGECGPCGGKVNRAA
jgi:hypothetical protein